MIKFCYVSPNPFITSHGPVKQGINLPRTCRPPTTPPPPAAAGGPLHRLSNAAFLRGCHRPPDPLRGKSSPYTPAPSDSPASALAPPFFSPSSPPPPPSDRLFFTLLDALIHSDRLEIARSLLSDIDLGFLPKVMHFVGLVQAYWDNAAIQSAIEVLDLMASRGSVPDVFFYGSLIHGGVAQCLLGGEADAGEWPGDRKGGGGGAEMERRGGAAPGPTIPRSPGSLTVGLLRTRSVRCDHILNFDWRMGKEGENVGMQCPGEDGGDGVFPDCMPLVFSFCFNYNGEMGWPEMRSGFLG